MPGPAILIVDSELLLRGEVPDLRPRDTLPLVAIFVLKLQTNASRSVMGESVRCSKMTAVWALK
jgi:hypothetical protein